MSFRDKGVRKACWESRDRYWACLDLPGIQRDHCMELRRLYEVACPGHWVSYSLADSTDVTTCINIIGTIVKMFPSLDFIV